MKRFLLIVLFLLIAFYVAWPAVSLWQMYGAVQAGDADRLKQKVDFAAVRSSMSPAVEAKIAAHVEKLKNAGGATGVIMGSVFNKGMLRDVTKVVLDYLVTAENIIRMSREKGTLSQKIDRLVDEQLERPATIAPTTKGDQIQPSATQPAGQATQADGSSPQGTAPPDFGMANLKGFRVLGPLTFEVSVAKDAQSPTADATARISFKDFDWKLTGLVPHDK